MLDRGVALAPGPYEVAFPSMAHGTDEYDLALSCAAESITEALAR
jgi:glutamate-1-semialdehyde 2,1-aminomutase